MVGHARLVFVRDGFGAATMGDIARSAGVAPGAVYWYFPTKDDALAAVGRSLVEETRREIETRPELVDDPLARVLFAVEAVGESRSLHTAVHDRLPHSEVVAQFHHEFHLWVEELLSDALRQQLPEEEDPELAAEAVMAVVDGRLSHERSGRPFGDVVRFVIDRLGGTANAAEPEPSAGAPA